MLGPIITNVQDFDKFDTFFRKQKFDAIKVVTGWPLPMAQVYGLTTNVIVRTTCGDPFNPHTNPYLDVNDMLREISPWYANKKNIYIQLGNEPNIDVDPYVYWYYFLMSCRAVREYFPKAKIISTPLQFNGSEKQWFEILKEQLKNYPANWDYSGWNVYEDHSFTNPSRHDVLKAQTYNKQYFNNQPMIACEVGINNPAVDRILQYRNLEKSFHMVAWFHYSDDLDSWPNYRIPS